MSAEPPRLRLVLAPCVAETAALTQLVTLELGASLVDDTVVVPDEPSLTRIDVRCDGELISIEVADPVSGKRLARTISLAEQPATARARLLALAITELVVAGWVELDADANDARATPAVDPAPVRARRAAAVTVLRRAALLPLVDIAPSRWTVAAIAASRRFSTDLDLRGVGLSVSRALSHRLTLGLDALAERGERAQGFGQVEVESVSAGPTLSIHTAIDRLAFEASTGVRFGLARMTGTPAMDTVLPVVGHAMTALWGGPLAAVAVRTRPTRHVAVGVGVEVGSVMFAAEGRTGDGSTVALDGAWLALWVTARAAL